MKHNLLLAGLWYGQEKPTMTTFLAPFMQEMNHLSSQGKNKKSLTILYSAPNAFPKLAGLQVDSPIGSITAKARLLMCSLDLPAKAIVLNTKQFNGQHGCSYCEDEGVPRVRTHLHRNWPYLTSSVTRTHTGMIQNAREAFQNGAPVSVLEIYAC